MYYMEMKVSFVNALCTIDVRLQSAREHKSARVELIDTNIVTYTFLRCERMEDMKASLAMYFVMIDRRMDDEDETDPRLLYGTSWRFQALEEVESWSLAMIPFTHDIQYYFKFK